LQKASADRLIVGTAAVEQIRLATLAKTDEWNQVVSLISAGASPERIAAATASAAEYELERIYEDDGLTHAFYLLTRILQVAAQPGFPEPSSELSVGDSYKPAKRAEFPKRLAELGLAVPGEPTLIEIVAGFVRATDLERLSIWTRERSIVGELAEHAAAETLTLLVGHDLPGLFWPPAPDVRQTLAMFGQPDRFGLVVHDFFSRLTSRLLSYFLSCELSQHVGPDRRFATIKEHTDFNAALDQHCRDMSSNIREISRDWYSRHWGVDRQGAGRFAKVAFDHIRAQLRFRRDANG
jgi:hypothetical protein